MSTTKSKPAKFVKTSSTVNPFAVAAAKATGNKVSKKPSAPTINVGKDLTADISRLAYLRNIVDRAKALLDTSYSAVMQKGRDVFSEQYLSKLTNIGSFNMATPDGALVKVIPSDRYGKIDEENANFLNTTYPKLKLVETNVSYSFNPEVLNKNFDKIAKALSTVEMSDEDRDALLVATKEFTVRKGAINELAVAGKRIPEVLAAISPVFQLRGPKAAPSCLVENPENPDQKIELIELLKNQLMAENTEGTEE